jgi:hypothetical protein
MSGMEMMLAEVTARVRRKKHLQPMTRGWERRIGIVVEEQMTKWQLVFSRGETSYAVWSDDSDADLVLRGEEHVMKQLFAGNELVYSAAKQKLRVDGTLRDQLKLDAILRLVCN